MLKLPPRGKPLLDAITKGFSVQILRDVAGTLSVDVYKLGTYIDIKTATLNRRLRDGVLTTDESDRLYRFTEVYDATLDLFDGDKTMADQWLNSPALGLGGEAPISVIRTSTGANDVLALIHKIEHGVLV
jgi:putative toxin-antitoxin system antitoxin component (TIGR02293 family)